MQIDIYYDKSRLKFLNSLYFAMQATETKKSFVELKHLLKAILWKNYNIVLYNFTNNTFPASSKYPPRKVV